MKVAKKELLNLKKPLNIRFEMTDLPFDDNPYIKRLAYAQCEVEIAYDSLDELKAEVKAEGVMICPCAVTLADVKVPFVIDDEIGLSFDDEDDCYFIENDLDLSDLVTIFILAEVPIKVVKNEKIEYPRGDGWRVMTEEAYEVSKREEIDPRWAKLKEYKFDEED